MKNLIPLQWKGILKKRFKRQLTLVSFTTDSPDYVNKMISQCKTIEEFRDLIKNLGYNRNIFFNLNKYYEYN